MNSATVTSRQQLIGDAVRPSGSVDLRAKCGKQATWLNRSCQRLVLGRLSSLKHGQIRLNDQCGTYVLGKNSHDDLQAKIDVRHPRFYRRLVTGRDLGLAEAYLDGDFDCDDLPSLFRIFCRNLDWHHTFGKTLELATRAGARIGYWLARNTRAGSCRNIGAHYDLGNEFFELFLDPRMMYSSAIFDDTDMSLARLLNPNGRMLLQAIVMPEQRYSGYLKSVDFIQKYIFPGGCLPSVIAMQNSMTRNSSLRLLSMHDFADGYARTLREWRRSFLERQEDVRRLGYSERFIRLWDYYLTYCEGAFEERAVGVVQAVWGR